MKGQLHMGDKSYTDAYQASDQVDHYEDRIYGPGEYDEVLWRVERRVLHKLLLRFSPRHACADAMDFACGSARVLAYLRPLVKTIVGVDVSPAMLRKAREKVDGGHFICADIVKNPDCVPGEKDIITCFRFLLLAEPELREACLKRLATKLSSRDGIMILGLHGNPYSRRALAGFRDRVTKRGTHKLPAFSLGDMEELADKCLLRVVGFAGLGYLPRTVARQLPVRMFWCIERILADRPFLRHFASNLLVVCKRR